MILYIFQQSSTGARVQAKVLEDALDDVVLMAGTPLDVEDPDEPYHIDERDVVYPTEDLGAAVAAMDPSIVFVHIFNDHVLQAIGEIGTCYPTVMRAGINISESLFSGSAVAMGIGRIVKTLQSFDHLVAPSTGTRRDLEGLGIGSERITVIPTAVTFDGRVRSPNPNAPIQVGCLSGRLTALKNQHVLVHAISSLRNRTPIERVNLTLTGQGSDYVNAMNQMVKALGLGDQVTFPGRIGDPDADFWPQVGVHCLPSYSERLSNAVLEAARAGVPSVLSDNAWADEFDTMLTAPPDDPDAWGEHIYELLTNDAYRVSVAREQQAEVRERYSTEAVVPMYDALFDDLLDGVTPFKVPGEAVFG